VADGYATTIASHHHEIPLHRAVVLQQSDTIMRPRGRRAAKGVWSSLKAVELANLTGPTLGEVITQGHRGIQRIRQTPQLAYSFLDRVRSGRVGGQAFDHQPGALGADPDAHGGAAVGWQAVPQQGGLLAVQEAVQPFEDFDQGVDVVVVVASRDVEGSPTNPLAVASTRPCSTRPSWRSDSRGVGPVGPGYPRHRGRRPASGCASC
jgi:hypothetical protein